jgi:outer membrane protein assembly factor BamB
MSARRLLPGFVLALFPLVSTADDWPQWRGPNRDARVTGFKAPASWPKELKKGWQVPVGEGVATPALVGGKLYVFARQDGKEITRCLDANTGDQVWKDEYESGGATGPAVGFSGPRASPTVADGKVVTLGVRGVLSCLDAATGKPVWRKDDFKGAWPQFHPSSSPIVADGLCIAELGGGEGKKGGIVAYELATGNEKWKWTNEGPAYSSPMLMTIDGTKAIVTEMSKSVVAIGATDGKELWQVPFTAPRGSYNASTPMVDGQLVIYSGIGNGRGTKAVKLEKKGDKLESKDQWTNPKTAVQFNTPVLRDGFLYGVSNKDELFCIDVKTGETLWTATPFPPAKRSGYGSVVDLGPVLMGLTQTGKLVVFEPNGKEFKEVANYEVAKSDTYAYPVVSGNRIYIKDKDAVTVWTIE